MRMPSKTSQNTHRRPRPAARKPRGLQTMSHTAWLEVQKAIQEMAQPSDRADLER